MSIPLTLGISMAAALATTLLRKPFSDKFGTSSLAKHIFNAGISFVAGVVLFCWGGFTFSPFSLFTIILGIAFGLVTAIQNITNLQAIALGPLSYTQVIVSLSTLIPALSGALIWGESLSIVQIIGMALLVVCLVLSVNKDSSGKKASVLWLVFCGIAFLFNGLIGVMQKWHQSSSHASELSTFLVVAFISSFLYSVISALIIVIRDRSRKKESDSASIIRDSFRPFMILMMLVCGGGAAINHRLNLYLSGVMDSAVFFPIVNGGGLILVTIFALILFRERLKPMQWVGLAAGIVSVVLLCDPF